MKHNEKKIAALNSLVGDFYYCVDSRDYVHSTTFVLLAHNALAPNEVIISLRAPVKTGFTFSDEPHETDLGYLEIDNTVFFIKPNSTSLINKPERDLSFNQRMLFDYQRLVTSSGNIMYKEKVKQLSRKLSVFCPILFNNKTWSIHVKRTPINEEYEIYDILVDDTVAWRQLAWGH